MVVGDLIDALRGLPPDAKVEAWHPSHDCGDFWVTAVTYDKHSRKDLPARQCRRSLGRRAHPAQRCGDGMSAMESGWVI